MTTPRSAAGLAWLLGVLLTTTALTAQTASSSPHPRDTAAVAAQSHRADAHARLGSKETADVAATDVRFVHEAAASGQKELALSRLAAQRATHADVRRYAQQLVDDHHDVNQQLARLAAQKGLPLTATPGDASADVASPVRDSAAATGSPVSGGTTAAGQKGLGSVGRPADDRRVTSGAADDAAASGRITASLKSDRDYQKLERTTGRAFDEQYLQLMVEEHQKAVELFEEAALGVSDPELRSFATRNVPALREHLQEARSLERTVVAE